MLSERGQKDHSAKKFKRRIDDRRTWSFLKPHVLPISDFKKKGIFFKADAKLELGFQQLLKVSWKI